MNGRQDFTFDRSHLVASSMPGGLVMAAGSYGELPTPFILPTSNGVFRTNLSDLNRTPLALGLTSTHQQYHGRCNSSFSWNTGTHFSSLVNGFNFGSVSSSVSPFHSSSAVHNVRNGWSSVTPGSEGVGHYCMASGFCSLFPLVSGNEMYNSLSSTSSLCSRFSPFHQSFHHICHNTKDVVLSSGIQLDTMMAYPQHLSSTSSTLRNITEDQNNSAMYFSKSFESSSGPRGDLWSDSPKSINSDGNNNNTNVCVNASEVQLINKHSKLPEISGNKKMRFEKAINSVEATPNYQKAFEPSLKKVGEQNLQTTSKHEHSQKRRKNSLEVNSLNSKQKLLPTTKFVNDQYSENNNQEKYLLSDIANTNKNKNKKNQNHEPLFLERKLLIKKDSNDRWGIQPQNINTEDTVKTSATTTTTATTTSTTTTATTITTTIVIPYTTTSITTVTSNKEVVNDFNKVVLVPPTTVVNKALDLSGQAHKISGNNADKQKVIGNKYQCNISNNTTDTRRNASVPLTIGVAVPSQSHMTTKVQNVYPLSNTGNKTPPNNKKIKIASPKSKTIQLNSQVVSIHDEEVKSATLTNSVCMANTSNCKMSRNRSCVKCKIDLKQTKKSALCSVVEPSSASLLPIFSPPISTSCSSTSVMPILSTQMTSPTSSLSSSSSSVSTPSSSSSISPSYSTIAEDLWKASENTPDPQCDVCDPHQIKPSMKRDSEKQQLKSLPEIQPKTVEILPLKKVKIMKGDTLILKPTIQNSPICKISKEQKDLPCSSKTLVSDKRNNPVVYNIENKTLSSFKTRGKSLACTTKTNISEKIVPAVKMNVQKVQPIPVSSECSVQLPAPCNFTSVTDQSLSLNNPQIQYPLDHQPSKTPFNSATIITVPVNTNCISSSTSSNSPSNELQPAIGVCPQPAFSVQTLPKPLTNTVPLNPSSVPIENLTLNDATFLQTNKITQFESELKDNITVAQVLPVNVLTSNSCEKTVPVKMSEQLTENSVLLQNPTVSVNIPIGIAVARQRQEQTTTQTTSLVASGTQWDDHSRTSASISPPWITSSHTSTYWVPQGHYAASTTAPFPLQFNSPDLTHLSFPPVGFQLARDSVTGHLLLIPTNIDITDRTNLWPTYGTTATQLQSNQQCQQLMIQQPILQQDQHQPVEYRLSVPEQLPTTEITKTRATEIQTDDQDDIAAISHGEISLNEKAEEKEKNVGSFTSPSEENTSHPSLLNNNSTSIDDSYSYNYQSDTTLPYMYGSSGVLQFAQAVQTESGKRSQGTSPLPNDECLPTCMEQLAQTNDDSNSCGTCESARMDSDCGTIHNEPQVADASNQTETPPPTEEDDIEMEDSSVNDNLIDGEADHETISQLDNTVITPVVDINNVKFSDDKNKDIIVNSEQDSRETNTIDMHGLQLLSNSIMEHEENFCDKISETEKLTEEINNNSEKCNSETVLNPKNLVEVVHTTDNALQKKLSSIPSSKSQNKTTALKLSPQCLGSNAVDSVPDSLKGLEGLGLLCALAEQRFVEENWNPEICNAANSSVALQKEPSKDVRCEQAESLSEINYDLDNELTSQEFSLILDDDIQAVDPGDNSLSVEKNSIPDSSEVEMRLRLVELQKKYKEKQQQLAKLQPKKEKEELEKIIIKRGPGRPRKHKISGFKTLDQQTNSVVTTLVKLEASPPLLETALDEPPIKKKKEIKKINTVRHLPTLFGPLFSKVIKKSKVKAPILKTKKLPSTALACYLKKLKLRKARSHGKTTKDISSEKTFVTVSVKNEILKNNTLNVVENVEEVPLNTNIKKECNEKKNCFLATSEENSCDEHKSQTSRQLEKDDTITEETNTASNLRSAVSETPVANDSSKKQDAESLNRSSESNRDFQFDNSGGLGLLANFACRVVKEKSDAKDCEKNTVAVEQSSIEPATTEKTSSPVALSSCVSSSFASIKRKPGRPKKPFLKKSENTNSDIEKKSKNEKMVKKNNPSGNGSKQENKSATDNSQPKLSFLEDEAWNRRRSERIFLNDINVSASTNYSESNSRISSSPPHLKPVTEELPVWRAKTSDNLKPPKHLTRAPDITKINKKPSKGDSVSAHNTASKKNHKDCRKSSKDYAEPDNLFQVLREKCKLNDGSDSRHSLSEPPKEDKNFTDIEILPENETEDRACTPEPRSCLISSDELVDKLRVLALIDGLFYAGHINAIQAPDVYGITFDGERGNRPHIYSREEILKKAILEIKPGPIRYLSEGTRICAYWSQQYRCLYPGTVMKSTSPDPEADENSVYVEFDDGDSGRIPISDIRMLHSTFPIVSYGPSPLVYTGKRRFRTASERNSESANEVNEKEKQKSSKVVEIESKTTTASPLSSAVTKDFTTSPTLSVHTLTPKIDKVDENISAKEMPTVTSLIISSNKNEEVMKKKIKKIKTVLKESSGSKAHKESAIISSSSSIFKSKKHKKHKDRSRSEEHRHHHHHHHHKHKHKHDRYEMHKSTEIKVKNKEVNNMKIIKTTDNTMKALPSVVKPSNFTAERKKSVLTVKIRTNSTDLSHLEISSRSEDSETQSLWDVSEVDKINYVDNGNNKEESRSEKNDATKEASQTKKLKIKKNNNVTSAKRKKRPPSIESKSKMAAFLPARQLWRWAGNSFRRPGTKGKGRKKFYKAITRGRETIVVGDSAVFLSTGRPHLPYIGRIEMMWEAWGGNMVVRVKWFYHPEETKGGRRETDLKGALYQSPHVDENDVQTISHKCEVLSWENYKKLQNNEALHSSKYGNIFDNNDIYYLAGTYDPTTGMVVMEPNINT